MSRASVDQYDKHGLLISGYDYINQAWVQDGKYVVCGHVEAGLLCACYGREHEGEPSRVYSDRAGGQFEKGQNGHHPDCDAPEEAYHNFQCSALCPLQYNLGGIASEEEQQIPVTTSATLLAEWLLYIDGMLDDRQLQRLIQRTRHFTGKVTV